MNTTVHFSAKRHCKTKTILASLCQDDSANNSKQFNFSFTSSIVGANRKCKMRQFDSSNGKRQQRRLCGSDALAAFRWQYFTGR